MNDKHLHREEVLYITYDGLLEPIGQSQILKYLIHLSNHHQFTILSLEKESDLADKSKLNECKSVLQNYKIKWKYKKYSQSGILGYFNNFMQLSLHTLKILLSQKILMVHIRGYAPGFVFWAISKFVKTQIIFDMRGYWPDEKHDRAGWHKSSIKYKFFKHLELFLLNFSSHIVVLTNQSKIYLEKTYLIPKEKISVIRTCVDEVQFKPEIYPISTLDDQLKIIELRIGYVGTIDTAYNFSKFLLLVKRLSLFHNNVKLIVLTGSPRQKVLDEIQNLELDINVEIDFMPRHSIAESIKTFNFLGFYLNENFSVTASMPTKIAESLACGIPVICNEFNKDIKSILLSNNSGYIYDFEFEMTKHQYQEIMELVTRSSIKSDCRETALKEFSLQTGVKAYNEIYNKLEIKQK